MAVIRGLVGQECAISYDRYSCPVQPRAIIENGVKTYAKQLGSLNRNQLMGVAYGLISLVRNRMEEDRIVTVTLDFAETLVSSNQIRDKDVVIAFCRALLSGQNTGDLELEACLTNRDLAMQVVQFYDQTNKFLKGLCERANLHKKLSQVGWGNNV